MKNILIASLLIVASVNAQAITDNKVNMDKVIAELASGKTIQQIIKEANSPIDVVTDLANAQPGSISEIIKAAILANPENTLEIVRVAIEDNPELAAEIVQAAVEVVPQLASEIVQVAVDTGADQDEMIIAALLGGANEEDIALKTAAGGFTSAPSLGAAPSQPGLGGGAGGGGPTASPN